jgi:hypothetical protein
MTTKPTLTSFNQVAPMIVQRYERYLPSAFDESMSLLEKVNKVIEYMNQIGELSNGLLEEWKSAVEWVTGDGLNKSVTNKLDAMVQDGTFDSFINGTVFTGFSDRLDTAEQELVAFNKVKVKQDKLIVSLTDERFGNAVGDGATDCTTAFNNAQTYLAENDGGILLIPSGVFYMQPITVKKGVYVQGTGKSLIFDHLNGILRGSVLLINGQGGASCVSFELENNVMGLSDISVYHSNSNHIKAVVHVQGNSFVQFRELEISALYLNNGVGLYVEPYIGTRNNGAHYNYHYNVSVVGNNLKYGIWYQGLSDYEGANSNIYYGGRVNGWYKCLVMRGNSTTNGAVNNLVFNDVTFEHTYNDNSPIAYYDDIKPVLGQNNPLYGVDFISVEAGKQNLFKGCRFEIGGVPTNYTDGVHGVLPVVGLIKLQNYDITQFNQFLGNAYFNTYFYDQGRSTLVNGEKAGLQLVPSNAPVCLMKKSNDQSIPTGVATPIYFNQVENYETLFSNDEITIKQDGVYKIDCQAIFSSFSGNWANISITVNGVDNETVGQYQGAVTYSATKRCTPSLSVVKRLARGTRLQFKVYHESGTSQLLNGWIASTWAQVYKL